MASIVEFLEARIAEDEAYAEQAQGEHYGWVDYWRAETELGTRTESVIYAHAFRFSPQRLFAECAAKRAILGMRATYAKAVHESVGVAWVGARCGQEVTGDALKALASVYNDHPDYQQEWARG